MNCRPLFPPSPFVVSFLLSTLREKRPRKPMVRSVMLVVGEIQWLGNGRSDRIRTCDVLLPKQVLYQAELRSVEWL